MNVRLLPLALLLLGAWPCLAQPHPFGGEVLDLGAQVEAIRSGETLEAREQAGRAFLETLYKDPFLKELGPRMALEAYVRRLAHGQTFDVEAFRTAGKNAIAQTSTTVDVGQAELQQKLDLLESVLSSPRRALPPARGPPVDGEALRSSNLPRILGNGHTRVMNMEAVPGAVVTHVSETVELPEGTSRRAVALDLYGRVLVPSGDGRGDLRAGLAHKEVGRAVLSPPVLHPMGAATEDVLKGVGPTPFANNRFNSKATGTFPLPEAVRDWERTEVLRRAGVAVYEPVAIVQLPYAEWSKSEGWRPVAVYVRRPRENLRVSDLNDLKPAQKRALVERLRGKIAAELESVGRSGAISDADVIRHFAERMGRTAGIFQGGIRHTGQGNFFFHGMLHDQNVSLMGEIVDVGNSDGVLETREQMREAWKQSNYAWWPDRIREYRDMRGDVETVIFERLVKAYNQRLASVTGGGISEAELKEIFARAYREGRRGQSASDPRTTLTTPRPVARAETRTERPTEETRPARTQQERLLDRYRRGDGTLEWGRMGREGVLREGGALAHFALALFLKEVAVVASTGDRARIEEFFDGLMTTDFYKHYGLFVAGARVSEVAYTRYLQRYVRPQFVNGLLKTNLVLAAGIALPMIVEGNFTGRAFAVSVGSLGLSTAAVRSGVAGIKWVMDLKKAKDTGTLARAGMNASRLAKVGGWFYTAVELAVILYVADEIGARVNAWLDEREARGALAEAGQTFLEAARAAQTPEELAAAADAYHDAWIDYRNFLYRPLHMDEALFADRLQRHARAAKLKADERRALLQRLGRHEALRNDAIRRHGSLEAYADHLAQDDEARLARDVNTAVDSYNMNREKHLREVYDDNRRDGRMLDGVADLDWLLAGAETGADGDPYGGSTNVFARFGRSRARGQLEDALGNASSNRMQAYDDERDVFGAVARVLRERGREDLAAVLDERRDVVSEVAAADRALVDGEGLIDTRERNGLIERVAAEAGE